MDWMDRNHHSRPRNLAGLVAILLMIAVVGASCANLPPIAGPAASPTAVPAAPGGPDLETPAAAVEAAQAALAEALGIETAAISVVASTEAEWPNGCLGIEQPGVMCTQAIVPGYQVILEAGEVTYEVRTDRSGRQVGIVPQVRAVPPAGAVPPGDGVPAVAFPAAAEQARVAAATALSAPLISVAIVSAEPEEWPDACLGLPEPLEVCAQMITPGYRVVLQADGQQLVYHTDEMGANVRREPQPDSAAGQVEDLPEAVDAIIVLRRDADGCSDAQLTLDGVKFGACGEELAAGEFLIDTFRVDQLAELEKLYAAFSASTPAGKVIFRGEGPIEATAVEQRMIAEWAHLVVEEIKSGPGAAQFGLGWRREGGIAGFCDDIAVDAGGHAVLYSCADTSAAPQWRRLTHDELTPFYGWLDTYAQAGVEQADPATADAMTISAFLAGRGTAEIDEASRAAILQFGATLLGSWANPTPVRYVTTLAEINLRKGPGESFDVVERIAAGQQVLVTGINPDNAWWRVACPDNTAGSCWITADSRLTEAIAPAEDSD